MTTEGEKKSGLLLPDETVKVKITDHNMSLFGKEMVKQDVEDTDHIILDIRQIYFENGNRWMYGTESRPDPNDPSRYIRVTGPDS